MSQYKTTSTRTAGLERQIENALARIGPANQEHARRELRRHCNKGNKASTRLDVALALRSFDKAIGGVDLAKATPDQIAAGVAALMDNVGPSSAGTYMVHVRSLLKELLNTDKLPRSIRFAAHAPDRPSFRDGQVLSD